MTWDAEVSDCTTPTFSDKLMLHHTVFLCVNGVANYGAAIAASARRDLGALYIRLSAEVGTFAEDGAELLIDNGWMEKMPGALDRDALLVR